MTRRIPTVLFVALLLGSCGPIDDGGRPATVPAGKYFGGDAGTSPVGAIPDIVLRDEARSRDITLNIEYPTRGISRPLIIWSHAFGASGRMYVGLSSYWASHGYVVIRPTHADLPPRGDDVWATNGPDAWRDRVRDITFIIDSLQQLEERYPELKGKINPARIGVGGHAYGAHTAMLIGGARTFPGPVSYADPRVTAIVAMSPPGPGERRGLTSDSWSELRMPALFITGSLDTGTTEGETAEWRKEPYQLSPAGDKWLIVIEGARAASFTGRMEDLMAAVARERATNDPLRDPMRDPLNPNPAPVRNERMATASEQGIMRQQEIFALARGSSLAFWDTYLVTDPDAHTALDNFFKRGGVTVAKK